MIVSKTKILMKQILVLMAILLLISACSDANKPEVGQVQEGETIEEITKEEEPVKPSPYQVTKERGYDCGVYEKEYDNNGNLITHTQFDRDGLTSLRTEYEYDSNGNVIKVAWYDSDGFNISLSEYEYEYDNANNIIKQTLYHDGSVLFWDEYEYDSNGNQIKDTVYNPDGSIAVAGINEYEYDGNGNRIKCTTFNLDGSVYMQYEYEYEYDSNGNVIKEIRYDSDGFAVILNNCEYEYDGNENLVKQTHFNSDGSIIYWNEYEYVIEGDEIIRIVKSYDRNGDPYEPCESQA